MAAATHWREPKVRRHSCPFSIARATQILSYYVVDKQEVCHTNALRSQHTEAAIIVKDETRRSKSQT
jgi:hypothetical protein